MVARKAGAGASQSRSDRRPRAPAPKSEQSSLASGLAAALLILGEGAMESAEPPAKKGMDKSEAAERAPPPKRPRTAPPRSKSAKPKNSKAAKAPPAPESTQATADSLAAVADESKEEAEESAPPVPRVPNFYRGACPSISLMRKAGYLGDERELKSVWDWVRDQGDNEVWPTPTAGAQEAVRFDACGWPNEKSTPDDWIPLLSYWTALREQLVGGASRAQRRAASKTMSSLGL